MSSTASMEGGVGQPGGGSMSEFLVQMENRIPADFDPDERERLHRAEGARARELAAAGILVRLWRVAGRRANAGIWRAASNVELHAALESLPMFPYLDIQVTPLSRHPNDPAPAAADPAPGP
jgi:muconolactone delta-isomerase